MEIKDYIINEFNNVDRVLKRVLDGLKQSELAWRPASGCNSIGLIIYHVVRFEDSFIQERIQGKLQVWETEKWYEKMGLPVEDVGAHYTAEQVNDFPVPDIKDIMDYAAATRKLTMEYLNGLTPQELDRKASTPRGESTIAAMLAMAVFHTAEHAGEIGYLRGIQRGMDK